MTALPRVRPGLLKHPLDKQVLVYDTALDRVHLLDPTTACVLELLEEGGHTAEGIGAQIVARLDLSPNAGFLPLAIEELRKADLLDLSNDCAQPMVDVKRRELLKSVAMTGAAALLIPTVASLTATRGYAQGTAPNHGACNTCTADSQCINSVCCSGICLPSCTGQPTGGCCSVNGQCASGSCVGGFCAQGTTGAGGACTINGNCASNVCCNGICSATGCPQTNGATCNANGQCASGNCCGGVCSAPGTNALCTSCVATCQCANGHPCTNGGCGNTNAKLLNGSACSSGPNSSCTQRRIDASALCCSGNCTNAGNVCTGSGSNQTFTGTCAP